MHCCHATTPQPSHASQEREENSTEKEEGSNGAEEMAQLLKVIVVKPNNLSSTFGLHIDQRVNQIQNLSSDTHTHTHCVKLKKNNWSKESNWLLKTEPN